MFEDRLDAAGRLATRLNAYRDATGTIVLGIPRGGLVVAARIATELGLSLGVAAAQKVGAPSNPELAIGAVDDESGQVLDDRMAGQLGISPDVLALAASSARARLRHWLRSVPGSETPPVDGRTVIIVDDGVATGYTARVAVEAVRRHGARRVVLAVPVAPADTARWLRRDVDEWISLETPEPFYAVGNSFRAWPQVTDDQVRALLLAGNRM